MLLTALVPLIYDGRRVPAGGRFSARDDDARVLIFIKRATPFQIQSGVDEAVNSAEAKPVQVKPKRKYTRRTLKDNDAA